MMGMSYDVVQWNGRRVLITCWWMWRTTGYYIIQAGHDEETNTEKETKTARPAATTLLLQQQPPPAPHQARRGVVIRYVMGMSWVPSHTYNGMDVVFDDSLTCEQTLRTRGVRSRCRQTQPRRAITRPTAHSRSAAGATATQVLVCWWRRGLWTGLLPLCRMSRAPKPPCHDEDMRCGVAWCGAGWELVV